MHCSRNKKIDTGHGRCHYLPALDYKQDDTCSDDDDNYHTNNHCNDDDVILCLFYS